jgi:hypothetical protein
MITLWISVESKQHVDEFEMDTNWWFFYLIIYLQLAATFLDRKEILLNVVVTQPTIRKAADPKNCITISREF